MLKSQHRSIDTCFCHKYVGCSNNNVLRYNRYYSSTTDQQHQRSNNTPGLRASEDPFNATSTLPIHIRSKSEVFESLKDKPTWKKWFAFGKELLVFYKEGIKNVLSNRKYSKYLMRSKYCIPLVNYKNKHSIESESGSGKCLNTYIKNPHDLTHYLSNEIYLRQIEDAAHDEEGQKVKLTNITRSEYQVILRTHSDIRKLPVFCLLYLIFEELTPFICYLFPKVIPTTCILPSLLKKEEMKKLKMTSNDSKALFYKFFRENSLYKLTHTELKLLSRYFGLSAFTRVSRNLMLKSLEDYRTEIMLDNYLIGDNVDKLNSLELILAGNNRALIDKSIVPNLELFTNGNSYDNGINLAFLRESLKKFIKETEYKI